MRYERKGMARFRGLYIKGMDSWMPKWKGKAPIQSPPLGQSNCGPGPMTGGLDFESEIATSVSSTVDLAGAWCLTAPGQVACLRPLAAPPALPAMRAMDTGFWIGCSSDTTLVVINRAPHAVVLHVNGFALTVEAKLSISRHFTYSASLFTTTKV